MAGLILLQGVSTTAVSVYNFWNASKYRLNTGTVDIMDSYTYGPGRKLEEIYGVSSSADLTLANYAAKSDFRFVVPAANLVGTYYKGKISVGSFLASTLVDTHTYYGTVVIQDLINNAYETDVMKTSVSLHSSTVNDVILSNTNQPDTNNTASYLDRLYGQEMIEYVVLQTPAMSIADTSSKNFSLLCQNSTNAVVYPTMSNILLFKTFTVGNFLEGRSALDDISVPQYLSRVDELSPPQTKSEVLSMIDKLVDSSDDTLISPMDITHSNTGHGFLKVGEEPMDADEHLPLTFEPVHSPVFRKDLQTEAVRRLVQREPGLLDRLTQEAEDSASTKGRLLRLGPIVTLTPTGFSVTTKKGYELREGDKTYHIGTLNHVPEGLVKAYEDRGMDSFVPVLEEQLNDPDFDFTPKDVHVFFRIKKIKEYNKAHGLLKDVPNYKAVLLKLIAKRAHRLKKPAKRRKRNLPKKKEPIEDSKVE